MSCGSCRSCRSCPGTRQDKRSCVPPVKSTQSRPSTPGPARSASSARDLRLCAAPQAPGSARLAPLLGLRAGPRRAWSSREQENRRREEPPRAVPKAGEQEWGGASARRAESRRTGGVRDFHKIMKPASEKRTRAWTETRFSNFQLGVYHNGRRRLAAPRISRTHQEFLHPHGGPLSAMGDSYLRMTANPEL